MHLNFDNNSLLNCSFLSLYDRDGIDTIGLDDAAARLGMLPPPFLISFLELLNLYNSNNSKSSLHFYYNWRCCRCWIVFLFSWILVYMCVVLIVMIFFYVIGDILGVERRRIYDIVNVLESIGVRSIVSCPFFPLVYLI